MKDDSNTFGIPEFMQEVQETRRKEAAQQAAQKELDELKRNSCNGKSWERTRNKKIKVPKKSCRKKLLKFVAVAAVAAGLTIGGIHKINDIRDQLIVNEQASEFYSEVMANTQQRLQSTDENPNNWGYDHYEINNRIEENEYDYDEALYFFLINLDHNKTYNMDTLIQCGRQYEDYADFLKQNGYENSEDFKETMKKKIVLESEIDERKKALSEMNKEHDTNKEQASNTNSMSKGGK